MGVSSGEKASQYQSPSISPSPLTASTNYRAPAVEGWGLPTWNTGREWNKQNSLPSCDWKPSKGGRKCEKKIVNRLVCYKMEMLLKNGAEKGDLEEVQD